MGADAVFPGLREGKMRDARTRAASGESPLRAGGAASVPGRSPSAFGRDDEIAEVLVLAL